PPGPDGRDPPPTRRQPCPRRVCGGPQPTGVGQCQRVPDNGAGAPDPESEVLVGQGQDQCVRGAAEIEGGVDGQGSPCQRQACPVQRTPRPMSIPPFPCPHDVRDYRRRRRCRGRRAESAKAGRRVRGTWRADAVAPNTGLLWRDRGRGCCRLDNTWSLLRGAMKSADAPSVLRTGTVRQVARFARPHWRRLLVFLLITVVTAVLAVTTPLLAGRVVDAIVDGRSVSTVVWLAVAIALIAVVDAGLGLAERWQSAHIGEGLILDLRKAVFEHVQRMPIAFFQRSRTGALVSRLNNDVIGAQRTFTATLSGLVTNVIQLVLSLAVMLTLSWQVTLLALVLLPMFVLPARRVG